MKKLNLFISMFFVFSILFVSQTPAQTVWKMAFVAPPPVWGPIAEKYGQIIAQKTNNQFQIKWFGGGQLGSLPQILAGIKTGQVDMILCDLASLAIAKGGKDFNVIFAPYVFRDQDHLRKTLASPVYKEMVEKVEKEGGFKYIGYVSDRAPRQITTTNRRVTKLEDLKGLKIRVPEIKIIMETMKAWGTAPTPLAASELYTALKQGVVEGQDNGFDSVAQAKYYEVQKYVIVVDYVRSGLIVLMAAEHWNKLNPDQKRIFQEAAGDTEKWATKWTNDSVDESIDILKKNGMEIIYPDLGPFKKLAAEANKKFEGDLWEKGLFDKIQAVK
ncbi:MAG: TRAP transporter substrate-binding protein [Deltaproteobacteria bacterium]|nr:TRAP transporter substrate-binding protein [Deltaproteobacteria bacterium]